MQAAAGNVVVAEKGENLCFVVIAVIEGQVENFIYIAYVGRTEKCVFVMGGISANGGGVGSFIWIGKVVLTVGFYAAGDFGGKLAVLQGLIG